MRDTLLLVLAMAVVAWLVELRDARFWKQRADYWFARANDAEGLTPSSDEVEWEKGYDFGLAIGRASKPRPYHRTYILDKPTFERIAEHAFLHDTTVKDLLDPARVSRRAGARGESDG